MKKNSHKLLWVSIWTGLLPLCAHAQLTVTENFNSSGTQNTWYAVNGACLTASTSYTGSSSAPPGSIPGCATSSGNPNNYYANIISGGSRMVGGYTGTLPDASGRGALRLTNGSLTTGTNGNNQTGAIVSTSPFPSNQGLNITFNTVTYGGNGYQNGSAYQKTGADGIAFFLTDASAYTATTGTAASGSSITYYPLITGSYGGSLGYDCSAGKSGGMPGAYIGLGIDEFGNFVNKNDNGYPGDPNSPGFSPNTVGLRGAGNITNGFFPTSGGTIAAGLITTAAQVCNYNYFTTSATGTNVSNTNVYTSNLPAVNSILSSTPNSSYTSAVISWVSSVVNNNGNNNDYYTRTTGTYPISRTIPASGSRPAAALMDYPVIAYSVLATANLIPNQEALSSTNNTSPLPNRPAATPISYSLSLTKTGLLSLTYSYNGGISTPVISNQSITGGGSSNVNNGAIPTNFLFGFSAGTGGGSNVHEITCFKAAQITDSASSAAGNVPQNTKVQNGEGNQIYLASYNPTYWTGSLTATPLTANADGSVTIGTVNSNGSINTSATWDASCVLTGTANNLPTPICGTTGGTNSPQSPTTRPIATWNGTTGVAFEYANLSTSQQTSLNAGDPSSTPLGASRVAYVRGDRSQESTNVFRSRYSVLGDIINSSPVWVGAPNFSYSISWNDLLYPTNPATEGGTSYSTFTTNQASRLNVVYIGSNDGMLHGFSAGQNSNGSFNQAVNTGQEVMAYVPSLALNTLHSTTPALDYSGLTYAHNAFVDATPGMGDLYYNGAWHTWLVGGLGDGGNAGGVVGSTTATAAGNIYALDITNPSLTQTETTAAATVIGDWTSSNITCAYTNGSVSGGCANYMGSIYGTPIIRRLHNGNWAAIFGNGLNSVNGTAGIFIMEVIKSSGAIQFTYIDTGAGPSSDPTGANTKNGISFVTSADLDGDHITDYVYAGDVLGNLWRFDLTGNSPTAWTSTSSTKPNPFKLFTASTSSALQPISAAVTVSSAIFGSNSYVMIDFGTGRQLPQTLSSGQNFSTGSQYLYGIWDWNMSAWNLSSSTQYQSIALISAPTVTSSNLTTQTLTQVTIPNTAANTSGTTQAYTATNRPLCLPGISNCSGTPSTSYGWVVALPNSTEQIIYNPTLNTGVFFVNSTIPAIVDSLACTVTAASGYTYAIDAGTGGASVAVFNGITGNTAANSPNIIALGINGVGTPYFVTATGTNGSTTITRDVVSMISQTHNGTPISEVVNLPCNNNCGIQTPGSPPGLGGRITWLEIR